MSSVFRHSLLVAIMADESDQTVRNRLHAVNIRARNPARKPDMTALHRRNVANIDDGTSTYGCMPCSATSPDFVCGSWTAESKYGDDLDNAMQITVLMVLLLLVLETLWCGVESQSREYRQSLFLCCPRPIY